MFLLAGFQLSVIIQEKVNRKDRVEIIICVMCNAVETTAPLCQILNVNKYVICHEEIIT